MDVKVIDNFLDAYAFDEIQKSIVGNNQFELYIGTQVAFTNIEQCTHDKVNNPDAMKEEEDNKWNLYFTHTYYNNDMPQSRYAEKVLNMIVPKFQSFGFHCLKRAKLNLYPNTPEIKEHQQHIDYPFPHTAALFSLNTCDGFTRMSDGTKVDSVENRLIIFDGSTLHNSSTTTNSKARYNINFNFL
tara:strand:+ start:192 stop:749 length:558 start_codon:yes stop_codon:yes gene_type:complete